MYLKALSELVLNTTATGLKRNDSKLRAAKALVKSNQVNFSNCRECQPDMK